MWGNDFVPLRLKIYGTTRFRMNKYFLLPLDGPMLWSLPACVGGAVVDRVVVVGRGVVMGMRTGMKMTLLSEGLRLSYYVNTWCGRLCDEDGLPWHLGSPVVLLVTLLLLGRFLHAGRGHRWRGHLRRRRRRRRRWRWCWRRWRISVLDVVVVLPAVVVVGVGIPELAGAAIQEPGRQRTLNENTICIFLNLIHLMNGYLRSSGFRNSKCMD